MSTPNSIHSAIHKLRLHLEEKQEDGEKHVWLTPKARKQLRHLPDTLSELVDPNAPPSAAPPVAAEHEARTEPAVIQEEAPPRKVSLMEAVKESLGEKPTHKPTPAPGSAVLQPEGSNAEEKLDWLREKARSWDAVKDLDSLRTTMVFAVGSPNADLMFVGEAPGAEEERQQEPFVGPAGQLLTKMIQAMGLSREKTWISNIVKFRPALPNQTENNRKPTTEEMASCLPFVLSEIEIIRPRVIVALGATAAEGLLGGPATVGKMRNRFHDLNGTPVMVTYHPSYLLRNTDIRERRKVWEDLLMVMERMELPISAKQRGFFRQ